MAFKLSKRSMDRLAGVHPDLVAVVHRAISRTEVDFAVLEGLRTEARQRQLVKAGASKTMNSRHLTGHAVDLGAWVGSTVRWDWPLYLKIAEGCNHRCAFCAIPHIRGAHRARPLDRIVDEARRLVNSGFREINIISQDVTAYRDPGNERVLLPELVRAVAAIDGRLVTKPSSLPCASAAKLKSRIDEISRMPLIETSMS
jgi:peptidoglycan L-alanyl-D-glutamate endopeptidase CwlK